MKAPQVTQPLGDGQGARRLEEAHRQGFRPVVALPHPRVLRFGCLAAEEFRLYQGPGAGGEPCRALEAGGEMGQREVLADGGMPFQLEQRDDGAAGSDAIREGQQMIDLLDQRAEGADIAPMKLPPGVRGFEKRNEFVGEIDHGGPAPAPAQRA